MENTMVANWPRAKAIKIRGIIKRIGLCGCGSGSGWECVLDVLQEAENHTDDGFYRDRWFEFAAHMLDSRGMLDHGVGIGCAWLTDDGKLLLEFLRAFGTDSYDMYDGSGHPFWASEFSWSETEDPGDVYSQWERQ
jgi:hypothetical protein